MNGYDREMNEEMDKVLKGCCIFYGAILLLSAGWIFYAWIQ